MRLCPGAPSRAAHGRATCPASCLPLEVCPCSRRYMALVQRSTSRRWDSLGCRRNKAVPVCHQSPTLPREQRERMGFLVTLSATSWLLFHRQYALFSGAFYPVCSCTWTSARWPSGQRRTALRQDCVERVAAGKDAAAFELSISKPATVA